MFLGRAREACTACVFPALSAQGLCAPLGVGTGVGEVDAALAARAALVSWAQTDFSGLGRLAGQAPHCCRVFRCGCHSAPR